MVSAAAVAGAAGAEGGGVIAGISLAVLVGDDAVGEGGMAETTEEGSVATGVAAAAAAGAAEAARVVRLAFSKCCFSLRTRGRRGYSRGCDRLGCCRGCRCCKCRPVSVLLLITNQGPA